MATETTVTVREYAIHKLAVLAAVNELLLRKPDEALDARRVLESNARELREIIGLLQGRA
jgi:hypothetical protein